MLMSIVWIVLFALLTVVGAFAIVVNRLRFQRRVAQEIRELSAMLPSRLPRPELAELPPPVARYRQLAVGERAPVRTLLMRHRGTFRTGPTAKAVPIRGTQLFTADPPGFSWTGRIQMAPGVWIDARDMSLAGVGSMRVLVDDTITIADAHGAQRSGVRSAAPR